MTTKLIDVMSIVRAASVMREVYRNGRCACGGHGTWERTVSRTIGGKDAIWMGCSSRNHRGQAVGDGLAGEGYHATIAILAACDRLGISIDDVVESRIISPVYVSGECVEGPLAVESEREILAARIKSGYSDPLGNRGLRARGIDREEVMAGIGEAKSSAAEPV